MPQKTTLVMSRLADEGRIARQGKGDHVNYRKPGCLYVITIDSGEKEVPKGTYARIAKMAGWK